MDTLKHWGLIFLLSYVGVDVLLFVVPFFPKVVHALEAIGWHYPS